jgi:hypothetical protein
MFKRITPVIGMVVCLFLVGCAVTPEEYNALGITYNDRGEYDKAILEYGRR